MARKPRTNQFAAGVAGIRKVLSGRRPALTCCRYFRCVKTIIPHTKSPQTVAMLVI
jgi:hypothetical protein